MPDVRAQWQRGRLSAAVYDAGVERERVARLFGRLLWGTDTRRLYASIAAVAEAPDGSAILDVPCGGGVAFRGLRPDQKVRYVAADISPFQLDRAREEASRRGLRIEFVEGDAEALSFPDASFDLVLTYNGLHCLPDPATAVREMVRVLRPGGTLRGTSVVAGAGMRQDALAAIFGRLGVLGVCPRPEQLDRWLTGAGMDEVRIVTSGAVAYFSARRVPAPIQDPLTRGGAVRDGAGR